MKTKEEFKQRILKGIKSDIETLESGYKVWWPLHGHGYLDAESLRVIAEHLDEINFFWDQEVKQSLNND